MARPIAYDRARVIELAALQFWEDGVGDCNVDDLTRRAGVNRHSLYAAFGGKAGLYLDALDFYVATIAAPYLAILEGGDDLDDLAHFFATVARDGFDARGCLVTNSVVELGRSDAKVAAIVDRYYARYVAAFAGLVARAQVGGSIRADLDPDAVAGWLLVTTQGVSVAARLGAPGPDVAEIVRQALAPQHG
ncbi:MULTISPECIES: TetR/AcrR family transcriptional regulator [unclassified Sphingomonas]|uniref:TetR/AcrR family transcriptional regulator n=1 Tax=unclassified Sphingomonas TaxID=196159 RepID=UPI000925AD09|nr:MULTISPECIES: TetR/AcrR family transcriptional regulator [unclassified Sphingomonas]OJU16700.1 MAG: hypothetical protein BGN95_10830 [Sphingomonas sp. 66-10]